MALVWFVDKFPRSRKPISYRRLEDFSSLVTSSASEADLLPVLLPCPLCCSGQQISASLVAHQLQNRRINKRKLQESANSLTSNETLSLPAASSSEGNQEYDDFMQLCQHVECMVESSIMKMKQRVEAQTHQEDQKVCKRNI